jgi:xanthine dehydrogenase accessory factor
LDRADRLIGMARKPKCQLGCQQRVKIIPPGNDGWTAFPFSTNIEALPPTKEHPALTHSCHANVADDIRPLLSERSANLTRFAIATLVAVDGPAPRDVGAQMLIAGDYRWGFLSGGCIEDDVARHGREVIAENTHRLLRYGEGSPWLDIKLACGAGISILVEPATIDDPAIATLLAGYRDRKPVLWQSDGDTRFARFDEQAHPSVQLWDGNSFEALFEPTLRLVVVGSDATALALAGLALHLGTETVLVDPGGPKNAPFGGIGYLNSVTVETLPLDRWTAVAVVTHDRDNDESMLAAALASNAFYVGAIGARSRLQSRIERLQQHGASAAAIARLRAPIGLHGLGKTPRDIALSIMSEVKRAFHSRSARARSESVSTSRITPSSLVGR